MPEHYEEKPPEAQQSTTPTKPRTNGKKMTDTQKKQLSKHMEKMKKDGMSTSEMKSHRMKMMGRMRKGESLNKAHKAVMSS